MTTVGTGQYTYKLVDDWGTLPVGLTFDHIVSVGVDSKDRVYAGFSKAPPVIVLDREGNYLSSWGSGALVDAHGIYLSPDDHMYVADKSEQVAVKFTLDGRPLLVLGTRGQPSDTGYIHGSPESSRVLRAAGPFNEPTKIVAARSGDIYVSDGDGNSRVHRFSADGRLIASWGTPGTQAPYEFDTLHGIWVDSHGKVYVCDRHNNRIQIFSAEGEFIDQWTDLCSPTDIQIDANETVYISEDPRSTDPRPAPHPFKGVSVRDKQGNVLARLPFPATPGAPHRLCVDSWGDVYVTGGHPLTIIKYVKVG